MKDVFPEFIRNLPEPALPVAGADARLFQGERGQAAFFRLPAGFVIPPHHHCAQWGIVVSGRMELTVSGEMRVYGKGDTYFIPAGAVHAVRCPEEVHAIDFFEDPGRYSPKK